MSKHSHTVSIGGSRRGQRIVECCCHYGRVEKPLDLRETVRIDSAQVCFAHRFCETTRNKTRVGCFSFTLAISQKVQIVRVRRKVNPLRIRCVESFHHVLEHPLFAAVLRTRYDVMSKALCRCFVRFMIAPPAPSLTMKSYSSLDRFLTKSKVQAQVGFAARKNKPTSAGQHTLALPESLEKFTFYKLAAWAFQEYFHLGVRLLYTSVPHHVAPQDGTGVFKSYGDRCSTTTASIHVESIVLVLPFCCPISLL